MFYGLGEEKRTKFRKKKRKIKEKPHRSQKWAGKNKRVSEDI